MDKIKQNAKLECKKCGRVIDRIENMKTGGFCWKHKPQDMKPDPKLKRRKVIEKVHEQETPQLVKPLYPGNQYQKGVYAWTKEGVMELLEDLNNGMTHEELVDKYRRSSNGIYQAKSKFFRKDDKEKYVLKKNLKLFKDVERDKAFQRAFGAKVLEKEQKATGWVDTDKPGVQKLTRPSPDQILADRIVALEVRINTYEELLVKTKQLISELKTVQEAMERREYVKNEWED